MKPRYAVAIAVCFLAIHFAVGQSATPANANTSRADAILNKNRAPLNGRNFEYFGGSLLAASIAWLVTSMGCQRKA
jgi:hypothetical protein